MAQSLFAGWRVPLPLAERQHSGSCVCLFVCVAWKILFWQAVKQRAAGVNTALSCGAFALDGLSLPGTGKRTGGLRRIDEPGGEKFAIPA